MQVPAPNPSLPNGYDLNYVLFNLTGPEAARQTKVCVLSDQCALCMPSLQEAGAMYAHSVQVTPGTATLLDLHCGVGLYRTSLLMSLHCMLA